MISDFDLTLRASRDVRSAYQWYQSKSAIVANRFLKSIDETISRIRQFPHSFIRIDRQHRLAKLKKFPYLVLYRVYPAYVLILRIGHSKRSDRYWEKWMK